MNQRIKDCLLGQESNYQYPFIWVWDPSEVSNEELCRIIDAIDQTGARGIMLEPKAHTGWCTDLWWDQLGFILEEAKKRDMKIWINDDVSVPTGKANWALVGAPEHLRRKALVQEVVDVIGPQKGACIDVDRFLQEGESLYAAIAYKVDYVNGELVHSNPIDLTANLQNDLLFWDAPAGCWRLTLIFLTRSRGVKEYWDYVDVLNPESCKPMISELYEPHYQHFKEYFGNTLSGFFTDEPLIGNVAQEAYRYDEKLGEDSVILPWRDDLIQVMAAAEGWTEEETRLALPAFWRDIGGKTPSLRRRYMDILTRCYSENYIKPIGRWCKEHGVLYVGHVLEDANAHFRFGRGTGHFFRSLEGQHTSGLDIIFEQIRPGSVDIPHAYIGSAKYADPHFYLYAQSRLAASCAHLYPHMEGRVMCEFAGGWSQGLSTRKFILNALVVGGSNLFNSAIYNPKQTEAEGVFFVKSNHKTSAQYPFMKGFMQYANRLCHMMSGGIHKANALVYYPAEADWAGDCKPMQHLATALMQAHVDLDFASWDLLQEGAASIRDGKLHINKESFDALVVPCCEFLPEEILERFDKIAEHVPVVFEDALPTVSETRQVFAPKYAICMPAEEIPGWFKKNDFVDFKLDGAPNLMHLHMRHGDAETYLFMNVSTFQPVDAEVAFPYTGSYMLYDAWDNAHVCRETADGKIRLQIAPRGALAVCFGKDMPGSNVEIISGELEHLPWQEIPEATVLQMSMTNYDGTICLPAAEMTAGALRNLAPEHPRFSGSVNYETVICTDRPVSYLDLGTVGEVARVTVNGIDCGEQISPPYRFRVADAWKMGENKIEIVVGSDAGYLERDYRFRLLPMPPTGLLGPIAIA